MKGRGYFSKRDNHFHLKQAKKSIEDAKLLASLSRMGFIGSGEMKFRTYPEMALAVLFFTSLFLAADSKPSCDDHNSNSPCVLENQPFTYRERFAPGAKEHECNFIRGSILEIRSKLPSSTAMLTRVLQQKGGFSTVCVTRKDFWGYYGLSKNTKAVFNARDNFIMYPSAGNNDEKLDSVGLHHEFIHAETSRRHKTRHCSPNLFSEQQKRNLKRSNIWPPSDDPNAAISELTVSPIWPPTYENFKHFYEGIFYPSAKKIEKLIEVHKKIYRKEIIGSKVYSKCQKKLAEIMLCDKPIDISEYEAIKPYIQQPDLLPKEIIMDDTGVIFKNIKLVQGNILRVFGTIEDVVSTFFYHYKTAKQEYKNQKDPVIALAELDTHLRTGLPDTAIRYFFPKLLEHLQKEEDCCDKGIKSRCYPGM